MPEPHTHDWHVVMTCLLSLPVDGMADRYVVWRCACGLVETITGAMRLGVPLQTPSFWKDHSSTPVRQVPRRRTLGQADRRH